MRLLNNASNIIKAISELSIARYGYSTNRKSHGLIQYWKSSWIDLVEEYLFKRDIIIKNKVNSEEKITQNTTIIEYEAQYIRAEKNQSMRMQRINRVRIHKRMYLPFELVNIDGRQPTNAYYNQEEISLIKWSMYDCDFEFEEVPLSKADYKEWYKFIK